MRRLARWCRKGAEAVAVGFFAALFALFLLQVFMRYVMNQPLDWTQEACVILYIWGVFWTSAFLVKERDHVAFTLLYDSVSPIARRVFLAIGALAVGAAFLIDLPYAIDYVQFMKIMTTPVAGIRFDIVFAIFPLFMAAVVIRALLTLVQLAGRDWRQLTGDHPDMALSNVDPAEREFE